MSAPKASPKPLAFPAFGPKIPLLACWKLGGRGENAGYDRVDATILSDGVLWLSSRTLSTSIDRDYLIMFRRLNDGPCHQRLRIRPFPGNDCIRLAPFRAIEIVADGKCPNEMLVFCTYSQSYTRTRVCST